jgi:hypothetical protein
VTTLRAVLKAAVEDGLVSINPAQGLGRFIKSERAARESSSLKTEVERLLQTGGESLNLREYTLVFTAIHAGLQEGELAGRGPC